MKILGGYVLEYGCHSHVEGCGVFQKLILSVVVGPFNVGTDILMDKWIQLNWIECPKSSLKLIG